MGLLTGKKALITGLLSNRSIAYGIAKSFVREGAELIVTYQNENVRARVEKAAADLAGAKLLPCDVSSDQEIADLFETIGASWDGIDVLVHSIAFAPQEALKGDFLDGISREAFRIAHEVSVYSFLALAKAARPMLTADASIMTLTYLGAERVMPNYNLMGLAKASLEAAVRYLAECLGSTGVRVNAISAGPIKTLAASGVSGFSNILHVYEKSAPLRRNIGIDEVGDVATFLASSLSRGITAEILHVDAGFHAVSPLLRD
jgi:enoyl-[acyl-carrier protein] reductase I